MRKQCVSSLVVILAAGVLAPSVLAQGGMLAGTVVNKETLEPIANAMVVLENPGANPPRIAQSTDGDGVFTVLGLNSGRWVLTAEADGFHPNPGQISIRQGRNPDVEITLDRIKHPLELALGAAALEGLDAAAIGDEIAAADAAYESADFDAALAGYDAALEKLPTMTDLHLKRGNTLQQLERYEEAIETFEAAVALAPQLQSQIESAITALRMAMGDYDAAGEALASGAGGSREDLYNLGEVEFAKGEIDAAAEWYEKAAAVDPEWAKPLFKLALVALNKGDMETAKQFFTQVVEKDPDSEEGTQAQATLAALP